LSLPTTYEQMSHDTASHSGSVTVSLAYAVSGQIFTVQIFEDKARLS